MYVRTMLVAAVCCGLVLGCASSRSGKVYSRDEAQRVQEVQMGTVLAVQEVTIEGTKTPIGAATGAIAGGVSARGGSNSTGGRVAGVLGAAVGGIVGAAAEEGLTRRSGLEVTIALDDGKTISVVQEADLEIQVDQRGRILTQRDGTTRVVP